MDLIIIGGGPAGCAAAIKAALGGLQTILVLRSRSDRSADHRPLESVHPGLEVLLKTVNAEKAVLYASRAVYTGIWRNEEFENLSSDPTNHWYGHHIDRAAFDEYMLFCVRKNNVAIMTDEVAENITFNEHSATVLFRSGLQFNSRYVIDATGRARWLGKKLKITEQYYSPPFTAWSGVAEGIAENIFDDGARFIAGKRGWTWLAPGPPGRCSWTKVAVTSHADLTPPIELSEFKHCNTVRSSNVRWRLFSRITCKKALIVGDAAGIIDPAAGQGVFNACNSGILAADAVISVIMADSNEETALLKYESYFFDSYHTKVKQLKQYYYDQKIFFE